MKRERFTLVEWIMIGGMITLLVSIFVDRIAGTKDVRRINDPAVIERAKNVDCNRCHQIGAVESWQTNLLWPKEEPFPK